MVQWLRTIENRASTTLCGLKARSVPPGKPTNERPSFDTARTVRDQRVDLVSRLIFRAENWLLFEFEFVP